MANIVKSSIKGVLINKGYKLLRVFPRPMMQFLKRQFGNKELVGCEVGVYKGENADWILKSLNIKKIFLIDPYIVYDDYTDSKKHYGIDQDPLNIAEKEAEQRVSKHGNKVVWLKKKAEEKETLKLVPDELDFVYLDGNHQYEFVKKDIELYYKKLKMGGVIGGDDIDNGLEREHDGVMRAVLEFINENNLKLHVGHNDWWVVKGLSKYSEHK